MIEGNSVKSKINSIAKIIGELLEKYYLVCLFVVFAVFLFSRLFHLDLTPAGIHYDEAGMAFDAKTLAAYGRDRHNNRLPFYLPAYGGGQSALYAYSLAFLLEFLPFSMFVMRLPAVIYGSLCFFSSFLLLREVFGDKKWALMGPILVTITPYFFASERWALDCNLFLSIATFSLYMYYRAHVKGKHKDYIFAGLALGLTLYTYALSYIVIPFFLLLTVIYLFVIKKLDIKKYVVMAIPLGIMGLPLLIMQLINMGKIAPFSFLIWDFPKLGFYRGGEMSLAAIPGNISKIWMMLVRGEQLTYICVPHFGPIYAVMIPFVVFGFILSIVYTINAVKERRLSFYPFLLAFTIAGYFMVLMISEELNIYTGNELYIAYVIYIAVSVKWIHDKCYLITPVILAAFAGCFLLFSNYYFRHYNEECGVQFMFVSTEYGDVVKYANDNYNPEHKKIYFGQAPLHMSYGEVIVGMFIDCPPDGWDSNFAENNMVDNVYLGLPPYDIDLDEDCLYILSKERYAHIYTYMATVGWTVDDRWDSYAIVYR